jgi:hypothetical protein
MKPAPCDISKEDVIRYKMQLQLIQETYQTRPIDISKEDVIRYKMQLQLIQETYQTRPM